MALYPTVSPSLCRLQPSPPPISRNSQPEHPRAWAGKAKLMVLAAMVAYLGLQQMCMDEGNSGM